MSIDIPVLHETYCDNDDTPLSSSQLQKHLTYLWYPPKKIVSHNLLFHFFWGNTYEQKRNLEHGRHGIAWHPQGLSLTWRQCAAQELLSRLKPKSLKLAQFPSEMQTSNLHLRFEKKHQHNMDDDS